MVRRVRGALRPWPTASAPLLPRPHGRSHAGETEGTRDGCPGRSRSEERLPRDPCRRSSGSGRERAMTAQAKAERTSRYHDVYARWQVDPAGFWAEAAREIDWIRPPATIFDA